jgi:flagellin-specific chaperone FliS
MEPERMKYLHNKYFELKEVTKDMSIEDIKNIYAVSIVRLFKVNFEEPERLREFRRYLEDIRTLYDRWIPNDDEK